MNLSKPSLLRPLLLSAMGVLGAANSANAVIVYQNDFESGLAPEFSPAPITTAPNASTKFLGRFSGGDPTGTTLSLIGLEAHTQITLSFDLYIIQSWDGTGNQGSGPDRLQFMFESATFLDATFSNRIGSTQSYSDATPLGGGPFTEKTDADIENNLGYPDFFGTNTVYHLSFSFAHTGANMTADFAGIGLQGVGDESWGLDNFVVSSNAGVVPEPASLAALGLGAVALLRRSRLRKS